MGQDLFAVVGAGGTVGGATVKTLLAQGRHVRAVVRNVEKARAGPLSTPTLAELSERGRLEVVQGDVTDPHSLRKALAGCQGIVYTASTPTYWDAKAVDGLGVKHAASAAKELGDCARFVLVSSQLVTPRFHPIRIMLNYLRWGLMDAKFQGEEFLRHSGVPYTVVRPGGLSEDSAGQAVLLAGQGDDVRGSGRVALGDLAEVLSAALTDPAARNVTLEIAGRPPAEGEAVPPLPAQLAALFKGLKPDG